MNNEQEIKPDWIYLPKDVEEVSLWNCLHDGELISSTSNLLERIVTLAFSVNHLLENKENIVFLLKLDEVTSVRAIGHFSCGFKVEEPFNVSSENKSDWLKEYWARYRQETLSWSEFETSLSTDPLQISEASYVFQNNETTLRLGGFLDGEKFDDIYFDVFLRGKTLSASRSDGKEFSIESFIELGTSYWEDFANSN